MIRPRFIHAAINRSSVYYMVCLCLSICCFWHSAGSLFVAATSARHPGHMIYNSNEFGSLFSPLSSFSVCSAHFVDALLNLLKRCFTWLTLLDKIDKMFVRPSASATRMNVCWRQCVACNAPTSIKLYISFLFHLMFALHLALVPIGALWAG